MPTQTVLPMVTPKGWLRSTSPTKRAAELTTHDTGRASSASARRRLAYRRTKYDGGWRHVRCLRAGLNSEHRTHHRLLESQEVVSHIYCRRDQRVLPHGRELKSAPWIHGPNRWNSRPHWGIRPLCLGDCENSCTVGDALEHAGCTSWRGRLEEQSFDRCGAAPQLFFNYKLDVFIEVHMDDLHSTGRTGAGADPSQPVAENPFQILGSERGRHEV